MKKKNTHITSIADVRTARAVAACLAETLPERPEAALKLQARISAETVRRLTAPRAAGTTGVVLPFPTSRGHRD